MPVTSYHTLNGRIRGQSSGGARTDYLSDALGSVTATVDQSSAVVDSYRAKPYGAALSATSSAPAPRFLWAGETGSRATGLPGAEQFNRARHYGSGHATWTSVDPLWPEEGAYAYVGGNPTSRIDPSGMTWLPLTTSALRDVLRKAGYWDWWLPNVQGGAFESCFAVASLLRHNNTYFPSDYRLERYRVGSVVPDFLLYLLYLQGTAGRYFTNSSFVELKAVNGVVDGDYSTGQGYGYLDYLSGDSPAARSRKAGVLPELHYVTTYDTDLSSTFKYAARYPALFFNTRPETMARRKPVYMTQTRAEYEQRCYPSGANYFLVRFTSFAVAANANPSSFSQVPYWVYSGRTCQFG